MSGDDVTITVRVNDRSEAGFRDINGRLRTMDGRFAATAASMRRSSDGFNNSVMSLQGSAASLTPSLMQVGAVLGTALLPALGAAAPAMLGLGAAAGTLKLGFAGVSGAMEAAGKGKKEYADALKKLSPQARDFTKAMVDLKGQFGGVGKEIQKAMLPGFTEAVKDAGPLVKILGRGMTDLGGSFGDAAKGVGRMMKDSGFQKDFATNLKLGTGFVKDMTRAMGPFVESFLSFGAKSKPTLDALTNLAGGTLSKGLPSMFKGLEGGIGGAAQVLDGLGYALNDKILPAIGEFSGQFAKLGGPVLKQTLMLLGDTAQVAFKGLGLALKAATPLMHDAENGLRGIRTFGADVAPTLKDIGTALASVFVPANYSSMAGPFTALADAIDRNKRAIQEGARVFGDGVLAMSGAAIKSAPTIIHMFRLMSEGVLTALDGVVSGAADAFGWVPGIGPKLKAANREFDTFKGAFLNGLSAAESKANSFAANAAPKLAAGKLKLDINNWESQIATAKAQLKNVPASKRAALRADIADLEAKVRAAKAQLASVQDRHVSVTTTFYSVGSPASGGIPVAKRNYAAGGRVRGYADGGDVQFAPNGLLSGPGSGTSDSILTLFASGAVGRTSNTEFVVNANATKKHLPLLEAINNDRLPKFAKGGMSQAMKDARGQLGSQFGISYFGRAAGYERTPFEKSLGAPSDVSSLVSALNGVAGQIKAAFSGHTESSLLKRLSSVGKSLIGYEKQLNSVTKSLASAKDKLNSLKDASSQLASSVKSGILSSANITSGASGSTVTVGSIMGGLTQSRDQATAFASALKQLKAKGLSSALIQQIGEAGISGGGLETAGALLGASSSEIKSLNSLQGQINSAAGSAGKTTADSVYAKAIKDQTAVVNKLTAQQAKLEKSMASLAKTMEKLISKALKGKAAGGIVGAAASGGLRGGLTWVGEHEPELLDLPVGSRVWSGPDSRRKAAEAPWASMLNSPRRAGTPANATPQEVRVVLEFARTVGGSTEFEELVLKTIRRAIRVRGGNAQNVLVGHRGRP
ncbi:hypothetical protein [Streptomyces sp. GbtcB6]|uniref:hypothetical protein n=1 Tax=Streptomyces sp. GbtcB6 TaxID=2824751 RepID=UPI001C310BB7|nr:hypothetical protein [Streptomyces sp. GbtcB6]